jgi:hypothetical protein
VTEPLERTPADIAEDEAFFRRYGPWDAFDPTALAAFMAGFERPWWIVGGWAIEAFTGAPREHEDVDLSILACDIPAFHAHVGDRWHLWSNHGGTLRPLDDRFPEVLDVESQIWVRAHALAPWVIDLPITPDRDGLWTSKRMPDHVAPLDEVTWVAESGSATWIRRSSALQGPPGSCQGRPRPGPHPPAPGRRQAGLAARRRPPDRAGAPVAGASLTRGLVPNRMISGLRHAVGDQTPSLRAGEPGAARPRPSTMTSRRSALVVPLLLLVPLAGCAGEDQTPVAKDPAPTTNGASPHWPEEGCDTHSAGNLDYVADAQGAATVEDAIASYVPDGATVVRKPAEPHRRAQWLVVNEANEIITALETFQGGNGWLVDYVEKCAD